MTAWGVPGMALVTLDDLRLFRDTPNDTLENVDVEAILVLLEGIAEDRLLAELGRIPGPDLVPEVAPVVGLEELVGQEALRLLPVVAAQHGAGPELGPGDASGRDGREREDGDREPGLPWAPTAAERRDHGSLSPVGMA